ncbi:hypothetical protein Ciccas_007437 [Cichlidogyrus casuarinus]|uniref:Homeobox domain-containing protein n=1 Tax=Cichlidogyrus casuarinus TaxID=1844966 RepID=A0ABD2Q6W2_9PLAT
MVTSSVNMTDKENVAPESKSFPVEYLARVPTPRELITGTIKDHVGYEYLNKLRLMWLTLNENSKVLQEGKQELFNRLSEGILPLSPDSSTVVRSGSMESSNTQSSEMRRYRKARAYFQSRDLELLEQQYRKTPYLSSRERFQLAQETGLSEDRIRTWFQNRRMREKRLERRIIGANSP